MRCGGSACRYRLLRPFRPPRFPACDRYAIAITVNCVRWIRCFCRIIFAYVRPQGRLTVDWDIRAHAIMMFCRVDIRSQSTRADRAGSV